MKNNYRVLETIENGVSTFYPQHFWSILGIGWWSTYEHNDEYKGCIHFKTLEEALKFLETKQIPEEHKTVIHPFMTIAR
jgi:hypothetical protein